ncbi:MAG: glycerophosphodiester phosphodiesterase family protein [Alphaproteobacteria bacterium]
MHPYLEHSVPVAIAHRGGALEQPENSMRAFEAAITLGYTYLETDAQATSDGVVIAFHDDMLDRATDLRGPVEQRTHAEISVARVSGTERIPVLQEVLTAWPNACFNIRVHSDAVISPLARVLRVANCLDRVCLASNSAKRLDLMREIFGERLCTALGPGDLSQLRRAAMGLPHRRLAGGCAQVPERTTLGGLLPWRLNERFLATAHKLGIPVHVATINEPAEMERLIELGVDGITTDRPSTLREVMQAQGLWLRNAPVLRAGVRQIH